MLMQGSRPERLVLCCGQELGAMSRLSELLRRGLVELIPRDLSIMVEVILAKEPLTAPAMTARLLQVAALAGIDRCRMVLHSSACYPNCGGDYRACDQTVANEAPHDYPPLSLYDLT